MAIAAQSAICNPTAKWTPGDSRACMIALICQRCGNCLIHCVCPPEELRHKHPDKLSESFRKQFVERPAGKRRSYWRGPAPASEAPRIEVIQEGELEQRIAELEAELKRMREVVEFAMYNAMETKR